MPKGSQFTKEYKREMVRLVTELGQRPADVAADIGVTARTVQKWVETLGTRGDDAFPAKGHLYTADEESRKQKKCIKDLEEENAILKEAMAIFAKGEN